MGTSPGEWHRFHYPSMHDEKSMRREYVMGDNPPQDTKWLAVDWDDAHKGQYAIESPPPGAITIDPYGRPLRQPFHDVVAPSGQRVKGTHLPEDREFIIKDSGKG